MNRTELDGNKKISFSDITKLEKILHIVTQDINIVDSHEQAEKVFSNFLNFIWVYNPDYKHSDNIDFLYEKPRTLFIEEVFASYEDFLEEQLLLCKSRLN